MHRGTLELMPQTFHAIRDLKLAKPSVVVAQVGNFGARIACEKFEIPLAIVNIEPTKFRSVYDSPVFPPFIMNRWMPKPLKSLQYWIADRFFIDPVIASEANYFRKQVELPPVRRLLHSWCHSPDMNIGLFPSWYARPSPDWPSNSVQTGFLFSNPKGAEKRSQRIRRFIESGPPPIRATKSTARGENPPPEGDHGWASRSQRCLRVSVLQTCAPFMNYN